MKKTFVFLTAIFLSLCWAGSLFASDYGTTSANFLKIPVAPVPAGLGQAYTAMYGTDSVLYNPGALAIMNYSSVSGAHAQYFSDMTQEYFAANMRFDFGTIALSYVSLSSGKFAGYQQTSGGPATDNPTGDISAQFSSMALSFSKSWPYFPEDRGMIDPMPITPFWGKMEEVEDFRVKTYRLSLGATIKRVSEDLYETTASTIGMDVGALLILPGHWQFGASALNYGGKIKHAYES